MLGSVEVGGDVEVDGPSELSSGGYGGVCCARSSRRQSRRYLALGRSLPETCREVQVSGRICRERMGEFAIASASAG